MCPITVVQTSSAANCDEMSKLTMTIDGILFEQRISSETGLASWSRHTNIDLGQLMRSGAFSAIIAEVATLGLKQTPLTRKHQYYDTVTPSYGKSDIGGNKPRQRLADPNRRGWVGFEQGENNKTGSKGLYTYAKRCTGGKGN